MRILRVAIGSLVLAVPLAAQASVQLTGGATMSTALVTDGVLHARLQPAIAPTVGIGIAIPTGKNPYRLRIDAHLSRAQLNVADQSGSTIDHLHSLTTIDVEVLGEGPIAGALRWQIGGGAIFYQPSTDESVFVDGGTHRWMLSGGLAWSHAVASKLNVVVVGKVDAHTFSTATLEARNYSGSQGVRRFGLHVGLERSF